METFLALVKCVGAVAELAAWLLKRRRRVEPDK
jgi:hypothetical protein